MLDVNTALSGDHDNKSVGLSERDWILEAQTLIPSDNQFERTVFLIHGFVGSPYDLKPIAYDLVENGYKVIAPVIPGQNYSSSLSERASTTPEDWFNDIRSEIDNEINHTGRKPILVGFSLGGLISIQMAIEDKCDSMVLLAPYFKLPTANNFIIGISRFISPLIPAIPKWKRGQINDPDGYKIYEPGTKLLSLKALLKLDEFANNIATQTKNILVPTLVIHSRNDVVASYDESKRLLSTNENVTFITLTESNHIIPYDFESSLVSSAIIKFIAEQQKR